MAEQPNADSEKQDDPGQGGGQPSGDLKYKVVINGEESEVSVDELIGGYQRQSDYTRKTQVLSEKEKRIDDLVEERATNLYTEALKKSEGEQPPAKEESHGTGDSEAEKRIAALEKRLEDAEKSRADAASDREFKAHLDFVKDKYPRADLDKCTIRFYNECKPTDDIRQFFDGVGKELHDAAEAYDQKVIDSYVKRRQQNAYGSGEGTGATPPSSERREAPKDFTSAREAAEARIEAAGTQ